MSESAIEPTRAAKLALEQVCSGKDPANVERLYHPDFVDHVNSTTHHGHAGVRSSIAMYQRMLDDLQFTVHDQVTEGAKVASRFTLRGTNRGRPVVLSGIVISRFQDGRIIEDWAMTDTLELIRQLGLRRTLILLARHWRQTRRR